MGQKATKLSSDIAVIMNTMAEEDKTYNAKLKKMRKQYLTAMTDSGYNGNNNDDVTARMQRTKGKVLSKDEQVREELALTLLTDMNDQKLFGNKFMPEVAAANVSGVSSEIVSDCILRAAHICLGRSLPQAAEAKLRKELREQIEKKLEHLSSLELRTLLIHYEEDETKRREQERANEEKQLKLSKELLIANTERDRREVAMLHEKEILAREIEEQKLRLADEEREQRRWRSLAAEDQRAKEAWMKERAILDQADILGGNAQGRRWQLEFQKFLRSAQKTSISIIDNLETPFKLKQIKPQQNDGKCYLHEDTQFQIFSFAHDLPQPVVLMEGFDRACCLEGDAVLCAPMVCTVKYQGVTVLCKSLQVVAATQEEDQAKQLSERKRSQLFSMVMDMIYGERRTSLTEAQMHNVDFPDDCAVVLYLLKLLRSVPEFGDPALLANMPALVRQTLFSQELVRRIQLLFSTPNPRLHGLCLRLLFLIFTATLAMDVANQQFHSVCAHFCNGEKFSHQVNVAIFSILLYQRDAIALQTDDDALSISFYVPVRHPGVWPALFVCLKDCDLHLRRAALQDINTIIFNNLKAVQAIGNSFAMNVFAAVSDVKKSRQQIEPEKSVYIFAMNILVQICMVNFGSVETTQPFPVLMESIFSDMHSFAGYTFQSCEFVGNFFYHVLKQLTGSAMYMSFNCDFDAKPWVNLQHLMDLVKWFTFQTAYWRSPRKNQKKDVDHPMEVYYPKALSTNDPKPVYEQSDVLLEKARVMIPFLKPGVEVDLKIYGIHYNSLGAWKDLQLVELIAAMLKSLHVDTLNRDLLAAMEQSEVDARTRLVKEYEFWSQAKELVILRKPLHMSYRKLADFIMRFLKAAKPEREIILDEIRKVKADAEEKAQHPKSPKQKPIEKKKETSLSGSTDDLSQNSLSFTLTQTLPSSLFTSTQTLEMDG